MKSTREIAREFVEKTKAGTNLEPMVDCLNACDCGAGVGGTHKLVCARLRPRILKIGDSVSFRIGDTIITGPLCDGLDAGSGDSGTLESDQPIVRE